MDLVKFTNGVVTTNSKIIADRFGKTHRDVIRAIKLLECSEEFRGRCFAQSYYTSTQNKRIKCYEITKDGFMFLGMGFTGKKAARWKEDYISAFNHMEAHISQSGTMMEKINSALAIMEQDKKTASLCAQGLNQWKRVKRKHKKEVDRLVNESQLVLSLE